MFFFILLFFCFLYNFSSTENSKEVLYLEASATKDSFDCLSPFSKDFKTVFFYSLSILKQASKCSFFLSSVMKVFAEKIFAYFLEYKLILNPLISMYFIGLKDNSDDDFINALKAAEEIRKTHLVENNQYDGLLDEVTVGIKFQCYTDFIHYLINKYNTFDDFYNPKIEQELDFKFVMHEYLFVLFNDLDFNEKKEKLNFICIIFKNFV